jgi:cytoskeletal protein CcmA (bactofilin family)
MFNKPINPFSKQPDPSPPAARDPLSPSARPSIPTTSQTANPSPHNAVASGANGRPASPQQQSAAPTTAASETTPMAADAESGSRLIVGPDVKLKSAEILDCDTLVVEGRVEATMDSRVIRIAENGLYSGKVGIDIADIYGHFEGELTARSQLIIHATGKVSGKIRYGKMLIEEGGQISGEIRSLSEEESTPLRSRSEILASVKTAVA